jgi:hypothetical protein
MGKPTTNIRLGDRVERVFDRLDQRFDCPCLSTTQPCFDLRPALLKGVEVRRIGRQGEEPCAPRRDPGLHSGDFVGREIVPEHDVPRTQGRAQHFADPTMKDRPLHSPIDHPGSVEPGETQSRQHSVIGPIVVRHTVYHSLSWRRPAIAARHCQRGTRLIDEFQLLDGEGLDRRAERGAQRLDTLRVALCRMK